MTAMLDSNVYDKLIQDEAACSLLERHVQDGSLNLFSTSVQINELNAIPDVHKRDRIRSLVEELRVRKLHVEYAPYGTAYGECFGGLSPQVRLRPEQMATSRQQLPDAMIALTATSENHNVDFLVTEDDRLKRKVNKEQLVTIAVSLHEFLDCIRTPYHAAEPDGII
jgi:rRNA-processing protein FCF1